MRTSIFAAALLCLPLAAFAAQPETPVTPAGHLAACKVHISLSKEISVTGGCAGAVLPGPVSKELRKGQ
jgi:hypothetical protein